MEKIAWQSFCSGWACCQILSSGWSSGFILTYGYCLAFVWMVSLSNLVRAAGVGVTDGSFGKGSSCLCSFSLRTSAKRWGLRYSPPSFFWSYVPKDEMWGSLILGIGRSWVGRWDLGWGLG